MTTQERQLQVNSQSKLINALTAACSTATALTTLEVVAALELVKAGLVMQMVMAQAAASERSSKPNGLIVPPNPN